MTDHAINLRAAAIHAEARDTFDLGPAPFSHAVDIAHDSGKRWTLRIWARFPVEGVEAAVALLNHAAPFGADGMALCLAWIHAANEEVALAVGMEAKVGVA